MWRGWEEGLGRGPTRGAPTLGHFISWAFLANDVVGITQSHGSGDRDPNPSLVIIIL